MNKEKIKLIAIIVLGVLLFFQTCRGCSKKQEAAFLEVKVEKQDSIINTYKDSVTVMRGEIETLRIKDSVTTQAYNHQVKATEMANNRKVNVIVKNTEPK